MKLAGRIDLKLHGISKPLRVPGKISIRKIIRHLCLGNGGNADNADNADNAGNADNELYGWVFGNGLIFFLNF